MLSDNIKDVKGIGTKYEKILNEKSINTLEDLIRLTPKGYNVYKLCNVLDIEDDINVTIKGMLISSIGLISRMKACVFSIESNNQKIKVVGFGMDYLRFRLKKGEEYTFFGLFRPKERTLYLKEIFFEDFKEFIEPIYPIKISNKVLQKIILDIFKKEKPILKDILPEDIRLKYNLMDYNSYLYKSHFPSSEDDIYKTAHRRMYETYLLYNIRLESLRYYYDTYRKEPKVFDYNKVLELIRGLQFRLTDDQMNAVSVILSEMREPHPLNRLIQGDVGSGKTIVAFIALYANYLAGFMGAMMVPSEVLSYQHYIKALDLFEGLGLRVELLNSSIKAKKRREILTDLANNKIDILIGTQSLFSLDVNYSNLGLVVIDEQHRFGVMQRQALINKGIHTDSLFLTATPIPRTLGISRFADLDITSIEAKPENRHDVMTKVIRCTDLEFICKAIYKNVSKGHQVFVVVPLIEESVDDDLYTIDKALQELTPHLEGVRFETLHGSMKNKDLVMERFKNHEFDVLVSTTVIEVGIDIRNATLMVIYNADRFGLSTLHQLRGRVGRNDLISGCILASNKDNDRLSIMETTYDCFKLSELDLKMRGAGDILGVSQSGFIKDSIISDIDTFNMAKEDAHRLYLDYLNGNKSDIVRSIIENENEINKLN